MKNGAYDGKGLKLPCIAFASIAAGAGCSTPWLGWCTGNNQSPTSALMK